MKSLTLIATLFFAFSALAVDKKPVTGIDALEIYEVMTVKLGTLVTTYEHSPDSGCWELSTTSLFGMLCEQVVCGSEKVSTCFFDDVNENDLELIRSVFRYEDLNPNNTLFID